MKEVQMNLTVKVLNLGDICGQWTAQLAGRAPGRTVTTPVNAFLVLGGERPVLVDAGTRSEEALTRLGIGLIPRWTEENTLEAQLGQHGVRIEDIGLVIQTHLHIDHAGLLDKLPMTTPVMVNRREMEVAFNGIDWFNYAPEDLHHILDRMYTPGALGFFDLEVGERAEVVPGISVFGLGGHTAGSIAVVVDTADGSACMCGDVIYDTHGALIQRSGQIAAFEPQTSGNFATSRQEEKRAVKLAVSLGRFLLPSHDRYGTVIEHGRAVGRIGASVPGPLLPLDPKYATAP
jgi:glyoxylase-like metal-dependent hydrolase (beta-lactamase superfamily II)